MIASLIFASCKKVIKEANVVEKTEIISTTVIDDFIKNQISTHRKFEWSTASDLMVWSALQQSDNMLSVGYKTDAAIAVEENLQNINIDDAEWKLSKEKILNIILKSEQELDKSIKLETIVPWEEHVLPVIDVIVKNPATVKLLRSSNLVRYAEPLGY